MELAEVGDLRIAYERRGDGPPFVLLHGLPCDSREWRRQTDGLSDELTVVAWDGPGSGRSRSSTPASRDRSSSCSPVSATCSTSRREST